MLGLAQQVHRTHFAVDRFVGNDQCLGRAGKQVDANPAVQLSLGLGHEHIARAHQHIHRRHRLSANGHGGHRLHTAQHQNLVGASKVHGRHDGRVRRALVGRRCSHHARHAGHLGGQNAHVRRCNQGVLAPRHIAASGIDRNMPMPQHHAGQGFHLDIAHAVALNLRKIADLGLRKPDVFNFAR